MTIKKTIIIVGWIIVWQILAMMVDSSILLASPLQVIRSLIFWLTQGGFYGAIINSMAHIILGFVMGYCIAAILAAMQYRYQLIDAVVSPLINLIQTIPVASFIILVLIWYPSKYLSLIISMLMVLPLAYISLRDGLNHRDPQFDELATIYHIHGFSYFRYIILPQLYPFVKTNMVMGIALCFKAGIAAELIGLPDHTLGSYLYQAKIFLASDDLLAITIVIVITAMLIKKGMIYLLDHVYERNDRV